MLGSSPSGTFVVTVSILRGNRARPWVARKRDSGGGGKDNHTVSGSALPAGRLAGQSSCANRDIVRHIERCLAWGPQPGVDLKLRLRALSPERGRKLTLWIIVRGLRLTYSIALVLVVQFGTAVVPIVFIELVSFFCVEC